MLRLGDLIALANVDLQDFKIHLATGIAPTPFEAFLDGSFKEWQEWQNRRNFECRHVVSLIRFGRDQWLLAGVYEVHGVSPRKYKGKTTYMYSTSLVPGLDHLVGRAIVRFKRNFRQAYLRGNRYIDRLVVAEIRPRRVSVGDFPGFHSVLLSSRLLRTVTREAVPSWKAALGNVSGVYVIVDTQTGKQYVGSAQGEGGFWQRWTNYAKTGHGGNKELRDLLRKKGASYADRFQFAVLEVCDIGANPEYVLQREAHWKRVLCSREFGYNGN